jgi:hypothetical protein
MAEIAFLNHFYNYSFIVRHSSFLMGAIDFFIRLCDIASLDFISIFKSWFLAFWSLLSATHVGGLARFKL